MTDAEKTFYAGEQLKFVDGLADEVIRATLGGLLDVAELVEGGDHQDLNVAGFVVALERPADLKTAHPRHHDFQQNEVGIVLLDFFQGFDAVVGSDDLDRQGLEECLKQLDVLNIVIDDHDRGLGEERLGIGRRLARRLRH